jgi:UDP-glucose 6-dehydrogenase
MEEDNREALREAVSEKLDGIISKEIIKRYTVKIKRDTDEIRENIVKKVLEKMIYPDSDILMPDSQTKKAWVKEVNISTIINYIVKAKEEADGLKFDAEIFYNI